MPDGPIWRRALAPASLALTAALSMPVHGQTAESGDATDHGEETEEIVVQATRSGRRVQDEPVRVEVIDAEEIAEKTLMVPGNIAMLVAETGGLRVQVTSPALNAANIRVRGLEGRYTQLLADGLPLYGGQAASLGLLQIPPTDLGRVEVIKGAASALYGPSALGGVINLVSRRPGDALEGELLANATTRDGQDLTGYVSAPIGADWGASLTGGAHRQSAQDLDGDGWADMPGYRRLTVRPRLFWSGADGATAYFTAGAMAEERRGGTFLPGRTAPDGQPFVQAQDTTRYDGGIVAALPVDGVGTLSVRASAMTQRHDHLFGPVAERDRHTTLFGEVSLAGGPVSTKWLLGAAFQRDAYRNRDLPAFDYAFEAPALFAQIEHDARPDLTVAASARLDAHCRYGTRLSPRVSVLYRPDAWTIRASLGRGFFAPTPFVDEIEDAGLSRLEPLGALRPEIADTASLDVGYRFGRTELNASVFAARVRNAVRLETIGPERVRLANAPGLTRTSGLELLIRHRWTSFVVTGSYVHVAASEPDPAGGRRAVERTPRNTAGVVAMWEEEGQGRIGIEAYYTGKQRLDENPYRTISRPYVELGLLGEIVVAPRASLFVNLENILGVRQTRFDPLLRPTRAPDGRWTVDVWAPTEGFVVNGGLRIRFGGA